MKWADPELQMGTIREETCGGGVPLSYNEWSSYEWSTCLQLNRVSCTHGVSLTARYVLRWFMVRSTVLNHCFSWNSHQGEQHTADCHRGFILTSYLISKLNEILDLFFNLGDKLQVFSGRGGGTERKIRSWNQWQEQWWMRQHRQTWRPLWGCRCTQR